MAAVRPSQLLAVVAVVVQLVSLVEAKESAESMSTGELVGYIVADIVLLCMAAMFAGLTLSVMGLDTLNLEIIAASGPEPDKSNAATILPIRRKGNQLLCTLILGNVMVNTLIAQITDRFVSGWVGVALSTALITLGAEIIPQATMAAHALKVGATSAPIVRFFLAAFYPVCKPIAIFLDKAIGNDPGQVYEREELKRLVAVHAKEHGAESGLLDTDVTLLFGAMDLGSRKVADAMTPLAEVFMVESSERLDANLLQSIWQAGHSRIPVYAQSRTNIVGLLYAKDLLMVNPTEESRIQDLVSFHRRSLLHASADQTLVAMLGEFKTGRSHMALVRRVVTRVGHDPTFETVGVLTLDDVLRQLIGDTVSDGEDEEPAAGATGAATTAEPAWPTHRTAGLPPAAAGPLTVPVSGVVVTAAAAALYGSRAARADRSLGDIGGAALRRVRPAALTRNHRRAAVYFLRESIAPFANIPADQLSEHLDTYGLVYDIVVPPTARGLSLRSRGNTLLYKGSTSSTIFTLVLQGTVQIVLPASGGEGQATSAAADGAADPLFMELGMWSTLGTPVLETAQQRGVQRRRRRKQSHHDDGSGTAAAPPYVPDFTARVVAKTTVLQLHLQDLEDLFAGMAE